MVEIDAWGGAQWILAFWLFLSVTFFPLTGLALRKKPVTSAWYGWYIAQLISNGTLFLVLAWGGFWV